MVLHELVRFGSKRFQEEDGRLVNIGLSSNLLAQVLHGPITQPIATPKIFRLQFHLKQPDGGLLVIPRLGAVFSDVFSDCLLVSGVIGFAL